MDVIAGRKTGGGIVGDIIVNGGSLLVEQKKRVTIGVEVVTNPSILFLDEPTSGLDVRSALIVMCGVQSIARTGRWLHDVLRRPWRGLCENAGVLRVDPRHDGDSPAAQPGHVMLEVIGAVIGRDVKDYSVEYKNSDSTRLSASLSAASVKKINPHIGLIYSSMDFTGVINLMTVLEVTCAERAVFYRESGVGQ
ncbi:hypothetical protein PR003_g30446 [Phytophthora rubi]|uniref:ABC transporter domain-containing protein n=1 Tax=Phytophthora rubi TaxID=129364 RepID=A0A6A3IFP3_9STRA|nr:hypothetical protein PR001_g24192 [Phytophthora rubi]KAE9271659.1 hypothetical protein PR003_g30446 [Phytophthora rubi]